MDEQKIVNPCDPKVLKELKRRFEKANNRCFFRDFLKPLLCFCIGLALGMLVIQIAIHVYNEDEEDNKLMGKAGASALDSVEDRELARVGASAVAPATTNVEKAAKWNESGEISATKIVLTNKDENYPLGAEINDSITNSP